MKQLVVSHNGHYLTESDGTPFFYLGDTAWELFHRLTREEAAVYLTKRAEQRFTVIQAVALAELDGLHTPNANGDLPLIDDDPTKPNEAYFSHVDDIVNTAEELGLVMGMLPTWGDKLPDPLWGVGPVIFNTENARIYGEYLGSRYRDKSIIWILGGDRPSETEEKRAIWRAMAEGLRAGDGGNHLISYHPWGVNSSADYVHQEDWLDFNMVQTSHGYRNHIYAYWQIFADYLRTPAKPSMDAEPCYEHIPVGNRTIDDLFDDYDVRQSTYWSLMAGGCGITYGCNEVWQMWDSGRHPEWLAHRPWHDVLDLPGANQMQYARDLYASHPFTKLRPDQALIAHRQGVYEHFAAATLADDGSFAFVYLPWGDPIDITMEKLAGPRVTAHWYDPRTGDRQSIGSYENHGRRSFTPPSNGRGNDWILVLESAVIPQVK